ncbi:MAG: cytidine deaminase [Firmicutes bacterium]|nr:cytidine deaminase [Bacillota bacterium]
MEYSELVNLARQARDFAYAPYSKFRVGAALLAVDGRVFLGCNVENVSFGLTICAERTAIVKAVSEGSRQFCSLAVIGDTSSYCRPCGACRQFIAEFGSEIVVIMANDQGEFEVSPISVLLPASFSLSVSVGEGKR